MQIKYLLVFSAVVVNFLVVGGEILPCGKWRFLLYWLFNTKLPQRINAYVNNARIRQVALETLAGPFI